MKRKFTVNSEQSTGDIRMRAVNGKLSPVNFSRAFTLIELLVVIAIIGLLASIVLASLNTAKQKGRDARRISDIKQIQLALELYYDACGNYPGNIYTTSTNNPCSSTGTPSSGLVSGGFISNVPRDPLGGSVACTAGTESSCYIYAALGTGAALTSYHLGASLELTTNTELQNDADRCGGPGSGACVTAGGTADGAQSTNSANSDFSGLSTAAGGTQCNATAGTLTTETCYDATP
jgi:prepilin-type N-terminal cleavage/methylation domain-containing protein